ncbi:MAG: hypothetical protein V1912_05145 [bacterium]
MGPGRPGGPAAPEGKGRRGLWIAVGAAAVVVIAVAIAVPLVLARDGGEEVVTVTPTAPTTSTTTESTSTTVPETSTTSTTVTTVKGMPGDSAGEWVEMNIPGAPAQVFAVAVSDDVLLMLAQASPGYRLYAYTFLSDTMVELPVEATDLGGIDVDANVTVWWEGTYDENSNSYTDQHIYSYVVPGGPKVEVIGGGRDVGYPQIAGSWVTWVEGSPWDANPEEYWLVPIYGSFVSVGTETTNEPTLLVPSAVAAIMGDSTWTYSLSEDFLAWEQAAAVGGLDTGTHVLDLMTVPGEPRSIGADAWRPSVCGDSLVYWEDGLKFLDLRTGEKREIDPKGDFATAAPTFAAYFRAIDSGDGSAYQIVARGFTGAYEQVLTQQADPPWLSPFVAASAAHVAFVADGTLHVFEWKGR